LSGDGRACCRAQGVPYRHPDTTVSPMNKIAELLPATNILVDLDAGSKTRLFDAVGGLFETHCGLLRNNVVDSLLAREKLGSTGLGQGIAIPHGRIKGLSDARGAFVRLKTPIPFDAPDGKPVGQVFVLLVPEHATERHLQLLSELAQMFSERGFREQLTLAPDPARLHALFIQWEPTA
jgi:PTS system nitrogen regulatory IIA component